MIFSPMYARYPNSVILMTAATIKPKSSTIPNFMAAVNPMTDQMVGITTNQPDILRWVQSNTPKVKIVVGQGATPKTGMWG